MALVGNRTLPLVALAVLLVASGVAAQPSPDARTPPPPPPSPSGPYTQPAPYPQQPPPYPPQDPNRPPVVYGYTPTPTGPDEMQYDGYVPYGYTKVERKRKGLIIGGAVTFGVTYIISTMVGAIGQDLQENGESGYDMSAMFIPIAGPFIQAGRSDSSTGRWWLVNLGLGQTAGAIMLYVGLTKPRTLLVRHDQVSVTPMVGDGATGMMVSGRF